MQDINWLDMLSYKEELHALSRALLTQNQKIQITNSEMEILSLIYLYPDKATPLELSVQSGMKKEAVSRTLKQLFEKEYVTKIRNKDDERSYHLILSKKGNAILNESYSLILKPFYTLAKLMGDDFMTMINLLKEANHHLKNI